MRSPLTARLLAGAAALALVLAPVAGHGDEEGHGHYGSGEARCSVSAIPILFGNYDPAARSATTTTGTISFDCTRSTPVRIVLGRGASRDYTRRYMRQGRFRLYYNLYLDAANSIVWGNGDGGTQYYSDPDPPANTSTPITVFGKIPPGQMNAHIGGYTDSLTVTIYF